MNHVPPLGRPRSRTLRRAWLRRAQKSSRGRRGDGLRVSAYNRWRDAKSLRAGRLRKELR